MYRVSREVRWYRGGSSMYWLLIHQVIFFLCKFRIIVTASSTYSAHTVTIFIDDLYVLFITRYDPSNVIGYTYDDEDNDQYTPPIIT